MANLEWLFFEATSHCQPWETAWCEIQFKVPMLHQWELVFAFSSLNDGKEGLLKAVSCTSSWLWCQCYSCLISMHSRRMSINFQHSWSVSCILYLRVIAIKLWYPIVWSEHMEFVTAPNNVQSCFRACWYEWLYRSRLEHLNFQIFFHSILVLAAYKLLL